MPLSEIADAAIFGSPELDTADDIRWIDFRPGLSYAKVRFDNNKDTEVLVDAYDGDVVSVASRRDAFIERLHSGEFIGGGWTLLSDATAVILILLTLNGLYLWVWPVWSGRTRASPESDLSARPTPGPSK